MEKRAKLNGELDLGVELCINVYKFLRRIKFSLEWMKGFPLHY